ncbi:helix-turn-helix domain-containing protein [Lysinibacillus xylanilyticus]|uniref:helix-turn-helix domain-containing protein n=1 Tax=Lysinibacillus xylanilyticus TaxID=582475 RepID=UPI00382D89FF
MDEKNIKLQFGANVKKIRTSKNLSQEKFAEIVGLHRTYITEVERGLRNVSLVNIVKIANGLDITVSELFQEVKKTK